MNNYIAHHGIKGQRWGVRRFQNEDGSLNDKGKKKQERLDKKAVEKEAKKQEQEAMKKLAKSMEVYQRNKDLKMIALSIPIAIGAAALANYTYFGNPLGVLSLLGK